MLDVILRIVAAEMPFQTRSSRNWKRDTEGNYIPNGRDGNFLETQLYIRRKPKLSVIVFPISFFFFLLLLSCVSFQKTSSKPVQGTGGQLQ